MGFIQNGQERQMLEIAKNGTSLSATSIYIYIYICIYILCYIILYLYYWYYYTIYDFFIWFLMVFITWVTSDFLYHFLYDFYMYQKTLFKIGFSAWWCKNTFFFVGFPLLPSWSSCFCAKIGTPQGSLNHLWVQPGFHLCCESIPLIYFQWNAVISWKIWWSTWS